MAKLTNEDIAFIAEMRTLAIQWKYLSFIYGMHPDTLRHKWYLGMSEGMK